MYIWIGRDDDGTLWAYANEPVWNQENKEWQDPKDHECWLRLDGRKFRTILRGTYTKAYTNLVPPARS